MAKSKKNIEPDQLRDIYFEYDTPLSNVVVLRYKRGIITAILVVFLGLIGSFFYHVPQEVNLAFELKGGGIETILQYDEPIKIIESYASIGDEIKAGERLMKIQSPIILDLLSQLKNAKNNKSSYQDFTRPRLEKTILVKQKEIENMEVYGSTLENQKSGFLQNQQKLINELKDAVSIADKKYQRNQSLFNSKTISEQQLDESYQELITSKSVLSSRRLEFDLRIKDIEILFMENRQKINQLKSEMELLKLSEKEVSNKAAIDVEKINEQIKFRYNRPEVLEDAIVIRSDKNGKITYLNNQEESIENNKVLCRLEGRKAEKKAYATLAKQDIAVLEKGQSVTLKFSNFPYLQFGTISGLISNISTASENGNFIIEIAINGSENPQLSGKILEGMGGVATILTNERRLINYLIDPLVNPFFNE